MLSKVFAFLVLVSLAFGASMGRLDSVANALATGAEDAVNLSLSLMGVMCFWNGIMRVLDGAQLTKYISLAVKPALSLVYSKPTLESCALSKISASFTANFLGLGNAALPLGISAVAEMKRLFDKTRDKRVMCDLLSFCVLNTVPFQLVPATLVALRSGAESKSPYSVVLPIWICSVLTIAFAVIMCRVCSYFVLRRKENEA